MNPLLQALIGAGIPVFTATWFLSSRLASMDTRIQAVEAKLDHLDSKREQIGQIPSILERLSRIEQKVFPL